MSVHQELLAFLVGVDPSEWRGYSGRQAGNLPFYIPFVVMYHDEVMVDVIDEEGSGATFAAAIYGKGYRP